jgi:hypothetical protein
VRRLPADTVIVASAPGLKSPATKPERNTSLELASEQTFELKSGSSAPTATA